MSKGVIPEQKAIYFTILWWKLYEEFKFEVWKFKCWEMKKKKNLAQSPLLPQRQRDCPHSVGVSQGGTLLILAQLHRPCSF